MPVLQNIYQIYKLTSTQIVENNLNIFNYTKSRATKEGTLISIGDNLVFQQIRKYYNEHRDHREIFEEVQNLRKAVKVYKKNGQIKEGKILLQKITDILFVKDIVNVEVISKKEYKYLARKGFIVNGIKYVRFCCGSGQMRRNTITFINENIYKTIYENLMCGLQKKISHFNLAKLHAYFALSFSSVMWVRTPRVCIIKDYFTTISQQKVDFIHKDDSGKSIVSEKIMDIELNSADGQGLIDPEFAKLWGEDMNLSYVPCSFVVRTVFIKGQVVSFDFKQYAIEHGITHIYDKWGLKYNINDIDILISESQFKMHSYYNSWQEYLSYINKSDIQWGVARYNKKYDEENVLTNYQYLQCLNIDREDIKELIKPTINWLQQICSGEQLYSILYMFGAKKEEALYQDMYGSAQSIFTKAVVKNVNMLEDTYIQRKIYKLIIESINKAKIGKIWVKGNYSFMISDPVAQCQSALGLEVKGLIPAECIYSNFWNKQTEGKIVLCRSPMIDNHETNVMDLFNNEQSQKWYQHIYSGIIYGIYDTSVCRAEDADFDGDLCMSTNNSIFLKGAQKHLNIITYEKGTVPVQKITLNNSIKTDLRGLGTGVGGFSNCATIIEAMKPLFQKEEQKDQLEELVLRKKLLREIVGQEIDRIKGTAAPILPRSWKHYEKIELTDSEETKIIKKKHNELVISKKPYFFRYLYPKLNQQFKKYEAAYNFMCKDMFGIKLKKLLMKKDKNNEEKKIINRYFKYCPLILSSCTMNILCKEFESIDFDIKFNKNSVSLLPNFNEKFTKDIEKYKKIQLLYKKYNNKKAIKVLHSILSYEGNVFNEDYYKMIFNITDTIKDEIQNEIFLLNIQGDEFLFYCHLLSQEYINFNWGFVWDILEEQILNYISQGDTYAPIRNPYGQEYLGENFILKDVSKNKNIQKTDREEQEDDFSIEFLNLEDYE